MAERHRVRWGGQAFAPVRVESLRESPQVRSMEEGGGYVAICDYHCGYCRGLRCSGLWEYGEPRTTWTSLVSVIRRIGNRNAEVWILLAGALERRLCL